MVQMHCKRCGANEDRINGFCSVECEEYYRLEEEINALDNVILERGAEIGRLNARIIEVTHLYLQTKDAFNLVTEVLLKQDARIAELEAENAELKERVAMLDVNSVYKSLGEMGYIEQTNRLHTSIAESESTIEQLIEAGKRLLDSLCIDPEEEKTVEVMNWKAVVDKVNKERER